MAKVGVVIVNWDGAKYLRANVEDKLDKSELILENSDEMVFLG